jgi:hypothetical protein
MRTPEFEFERWVRTDGADDKFAADLKNATTADLVIYLGPAGTDAWAEVGAAWGSGVPIYGITGKGEPAGLMRKMVFWCSSVNELLAQIAKECALGLHRGLGKEIAIGPHYSRSTNSGLKPRPLGASKEEGKNP